MIQQHAQHVFSLSGSPHRVMARPPQQQPRSILKKSSSAPTSPSYTTPSSPLASPPLMSSPFESFAVTGYRPQQWSVIGIARAQMRRPSMTAYSVNAQTANTSLTVTLLYVPTETLYAWPFNLSSPGAKGVCYETCSSEKDGAAARIPPEGTMSISLRVLADVIRCWMRIRRERSVLAQHRGSTGMLTSPTSPATSLDQVLDDDEVISDIIDTLRLYQLTPFERSIYLLRQRLPEQSTSESPKQSRQSNVSDQPTPPRGRPQSSSSSSEDGSEDDRDSHHRSDSCGSSQASTVEASPDRSIHPKLTASPKLPKINTIAASSESHDTKTAVPQIHLVEATPQDSAYEERDRILEKSTPKTARGGSFGSRSMDTVHEDASEAVDTDEGSTSSDCGPVKFIDIQACRRAGAEEMPSPKTATSPGPLTAPETSSEEATSSSSKTARATPAKVSFRDPFKGIQRSSSKPEILVEPIEYGSPESLLNSGKIKSSKRPSLDGLRSIFGGRSKSQ
ncbi:hypothetical protein EX895_004473 [Sporisorium graminicola]|uniref:Uncharacterized protein n=1 Tax=Sporisorium graminicola TaxID=280036 RepID=A0A4U7KV13_9BASI|nr:hypothetical protein EX895_004473 [Sporisorium graminicola]TKY86832.1 hypothetical protein EX895_004473 [Sporisorium graminicola]